MKQIKELQAQEGKDIWLYGGGGVADQFIKADMIDEYILAHIPIILGKGRPLFLKDNPALELTLKETSVHEGIIIGIYTRRS